MRARGRRRWPRAICRTSPTFTAERLTPKLDKLNPVEGFKRVFGKAAVAAFLKSLAKLALVGAVLAWALWPHDAALEHMPLLDPAALLPYVQDRAVSMLIALASAAALLAVVDYVFTRQSYMKRQRMSRREIKEEMRQSEGDPMVKAKLRQIRTERSRRRMMAQRAAGQRRHHQPDSLRRRAAIRAGRDAGADLPGQGRRCGGATNSRSRAKSTTFRLWKTRRWRARCSPPPISMSRSRHEHYEAVAKVIGFVHAAWRGDAGGAAQCAVSSGDGFPTAAQRAPEPESGSSDA